MSLQTVLYFLLSAGAFALMMRFGCGAHVMGQGHKHPGTSDETGQGGGGSIAQSRSEQGTDPVCGMSVRTAQAKTAVHEGHIYYFCSQACREKFEAAPITYVKAGNATAPLQQEHRHGCC